MSSFSFVVFVNQFNRILLNNGLCLMYTKKVKRVASMTIESTKNNVSILSLYVGYFPRCLEAGSFYYLTASSCLFKTWYKKYQINCRAGDLEIFQILLWFGRTSSKRTKFSVRFNFVVTIFFEIFWIFIHKNTHTYMKKV